jgi:hypothetical protein
LGQHVIEGGNPRPVECGQRLRSHHRGEHRAELDHQSAHDLGRGDGDDLRPRLFRQVRRVVAQVPGGGQEDLLLGGVEVDSDGTVTTLPSR